jgi:hypothetical protein
MMAGVGVKNPEGAARNLEGVVTNLEGVVTNLEGGRVNEMAGDDLEGMVLKQVKLGEVSACVA